MDHVDKANKYIDDVLNGDIPVCEYTRLACLRQKENLKNGVDGFHFDRDLANKPCKFLELLPITKGGTGNIVLLGWACFIFTTIFGWVNEYKHRRFRTALVYVPKKNAKSTFGAGIGLFGLVADGEKGAEIYSAATKKEQACIVWDIATAMVNQTPELKSHFGITTGKPNIYQESTGSKFRALSREKDGSNDGYDVHMGIIDEIHALTGVNGAAMFDIVSRGTIARLQSLILGITTAGGNLSGIGYEKCQYGQKILDKKIVDESTFFVYYGIDKKDIDENKEELFTNPYYWKKANPNWHFINEDNFKNLATAAINSVREQAGFMTKHLNVFIGSTNPWINSLSWDICKAEINIDMFIGCECLIGIDLASKKDICSLGILIYGNDGQKYLITRHYINATAAKKENNSKYAEWVEQGFLIVAGVDRTDYKFIQDDILDISKKLRIKDAIFDPHQAAFIESNLQDYDIEVSEWPQTMNMMSEPAKIFESWVLSKEITHDNNPVMNWMVSNTQVYEGPHEQIKPVKESKDSVNKIDGVIATIFTVGRHSLYAENNDVDDADDLFQFG